MIGCIKRQDETESQIFSKVRVHLGAVTLALLRTSSLDASSIKTVVNAGPPM
jgi:hypothetical protein